MLKVKNVQNSTVFPGKRHVKKVQPHITYFSCENHYQIGSYLPIWRSHKRIGRRCHGSRSKVSKFHLAWFCQKNISCFDISGFKEHRKLFLFLSLDCVENDKNQITFCKAGREKSKQWSSSMISQLGQYELRFKLENKRIHINM